MSTQHLGQDCSHTAVAHTGPSVWPKTWHTLAHVCGPQSGACAWPKQWDAMWHSVSQCLGDNALWPMQGSQTVAHALWWPKHWLTLWPTLAGPCTMWPTHVFLRYRGPHSLLRVLDLQLRTEKSHVLSFAQEAKVGLCCSLLV